MKQIIVTTTLLFSLSACTTGGQPLTAQQIFTKENIGGVIGAAGGAWAGSNVGKGKGNIAAIATGTLLGGFVGKSIGSSLDKADKLYHAQTHQKALELNKTGKRTSWDNPDTGNKGSVTPTKTFKQGRLDCREYIQTITTGLDSHQATGVACRQSDGTWKIQ
jgi:surface antigen